VKSDKHRSPILL